MMIDLLLIEALLGSWRHIELPYSCQAPKAMFTLCYQHVGERQIFVNERTLG